MKSTGEVSVRRLSDCLHCSNWSLPTVGSSQDSRNGAVYMAAYLATLATGWTVSLGKSPDSPKAM